MASAFAERIARTVLFLGAALFLFGGALFVGIGFAPSGYWSAFEIFSWALMIGGALGCGGSIAFMAARAPPPPPEYESTIQPFMQKKNTQSKPN